MSQPQGGRRRVTTQGDRRVNAGRRRREAASRRSRTAAGRAWAARVACFLSRGEPEEARRDLGETKSRNPALGLSPPYIKLVSPTGTHG